MKLCETVAFETPMPHVGAKLQVEVPNSANATSAGVLRTMATCEHEPCTLGSQVASETKGVDRKPITKSN